MKIKPVCDSLSSSIIDDSFDVNPYGKFSWGQFQVEWSDSVCGAYVRTHECSGLKGHGLNVNRMEKEKTKLISPGISTML